MNDVFYDPSLAISIALCVGLVVQIFARHLGLPGIVLLLAAGVALGPDGLAVVQPDSLGDALRMLVGFAVAVILFEGGLNLELGHLLNAARPIRQLILVGAPVSAAVATFLGHLVLGWDWGQSILFGILAMVTGPTVINPLMKRFKIESETAQILEAEGVLIDAVGAIAAAVAFEILVRQTHEVAGGLFELVARLAFGLLLGLAVGSTLAWTLRRRHVIPEGLENVYTLTVVLAAFQVSNAVLHESGLAVVTVAGIVLGNVRNSVGKELREFKEQLTVMLLGMLFVLLAADVRIEDIVALGPKALIGVAAMVLVVRPFSVFMGTLGTTLGKRKRTFLAWIGPRGIVAAAVASYFAGELEAAGVAQGSELRAFMFVVIAFTVLSAGLTGGFVADALGVRATAKGWVILGAHELSQKLAVILGRNDEPVVLLDSNLEAVRHARAGGLRVIHGNALSEDTLQQAAVAMRRGVVAMTANEEVNLLFSREARRQAGPDVPVYSVISDDEIGITPSMVHEARAELFGGLTVDVELWDVRLRRGTARIERWTLVESPGESTRFAPPDATLLVALAVERDGMNRAFGEGTSLRKNDTLWLVLNREREREAYDWLESRGLRASRDDEDSGASPVAAS